MRPAGRATVARESSDSCGQRDTDRVPGLDDLAQRVEVLFFRAEDQIPAGGIAAIAGDDPATPGLAALRAHRVGRRLAPGRRPGFGPGLSSWSATILPGSGVWSAAKRDSASARLAISPPGCPGVRVRERWQVMAQGVQGRKVGRGNRSIQVQTPKSVFEDTDSVESESRRRIEIPFGDGIEAAGDFFRGFQFAHVALSRSVLLGVVAKRLEQKMDDDQIVGLGHHAQRAHPFSDQGVFVAGEVP